MAPLAQSLVSRLSERWPPRGRRRHTMVVEALVPLDAACVATVYTNAPKTAPRGPFPSICVHYCDPKATHNPSPRRNSVHECPNPARRGPILPFVYTIAIPRPPTTQAHGATVYTNAPKQLREAIFANLCTLLRPHGRSHDRAGHGSHDIGGPMAPVMPGCLDLGPTLPECWRNHPPTRTHEASVFSSHFLLSWDEKMR